MEEASEVGKEASWGSFEWLIVYSKQGQGGRGKPRILTKSGSDNYNMQY
jgi:hypothetical protein